MTLKDNIKLIVKSEHWDPFSVLGMHEDKSGKKHFIVVRAFLPEAEETWIVDVKNNSSHKMEKIHNAGFFERKFPEAKDFFKYKFKIKNHNGAVSEFHDPYSFLPVLTDYDLYLIGEGSHYETHEKLGAHIREINRIKGVHFAVWAPNAKRVSVVGDFNCWDGRQHQMRVLGSSGIWKYSFQNLIQAKSINLKSYQKQMRFF